MVNDVWARHRFLQGWNCNFTSCGGSLCKFALHSCLCLMVTIYVINRLSNEICGYLKKITKHGMGLKISFPYLIPYKLPPSNSHSPTISLPNTLQLSRNLYPLFYPIELPKIYTSYSLRSEISVGELKSPTLIFDRREYYIWHEPDILSQRYNVPS
jgi:hypothetical protein